MRKEKVTDSTVRKIDDLIFREKQFAAGQRLPGENAFAKMLGVSRSTLREAIKILEGQGILCVRRGKGTFVAEDLNVREYDFSSLERVKKELKDLYEARLLFEPEMAALACIRATEEEIEEIVDIQTKLEQAIRKGEENIRLGQQFHNAIVMAAHNEFLLRLLPIIDDSIAEAIRVYGDKMDFTHYTLEDHRMIVEFIRRRDGVGAMHAMSIHLKHGIYALHLNKDN
ncbi:DNA-binding transcriptional regulator, FadR family [Lachnospiraceae bacterium XBB1006]|nr:DNA-binding transcriptional regulator, FadR family [Lachnospiraceae bacterium XBB1006]